MKFAILIFIIGLGGILLFGQVNEKAKCYTIDRSIKEWHTPDSINTSVNNQYNLSIVNINVYPNPANNSIVFDILIKNDFIQKAEITDLNGKLIITFDINKIDNNIINWNLLDHKDNKAGSGHYIITIYTKETHFSHKFIIN